MFRIDGYNFICRNRTKPRGEVGIYIKSNIYFRIFVLQQNPITSDLLLEGSTEFLVQTQVHLLIAMTKFWNNSNPRNLMCIWAQTTTFTMLKLTQANPKLNYWKHF